MGVLKKIKNGVINTTVRTVNKFLHNKPRIARLAHQVVGGALTVYNRMKGNPYSRATQHLFVGDPIHETWGSRYKGQKKVLKVRKRPPPHYVPVVDKAHRKSYHTGKHGWYRKKYDNMAYRYY